MNFIRRKLGVLLLPLVLALGPGLTLCVHACQVRGTEVSVGANAHCCKSHGNDSTQGLVFESAACCSESDAQLQLTAPVQRPESISVSAPAIAVLTVIAAPEPSVRDNDFFVDGIRWGPPRYASGRARLIRYSIARV